MISLSERSLPTISGNMTLKTCWKTVLQYPNQVDVIGRVIGVAMHLSYDHEETRSRPKVRSAVRLR